MDIMNKADTLKAIDSVKRRSSTLRVDIQNAALGSMMHAYDHGDLTLATKLVKAVSANNATQLRKYMGEFMPVRWDKKVGFKKVKNRNGFRVTDAMDCYWDDFDAAEKPSVGYNAMNDIKSLVKAIEARIVKADDNDDAAMAAVYAELLDIAAR